jgi:hypothetical protein
MGRIIRSTGLQQSATTQAALQAAWDIDPLLGNDGNAGSPGAPLKTFAEYTRRLGTNEPILKQSTTIRFLSSQPDNTDPVVFRPRIQNGAIVTIQGVPTVLATISLGGVVAKNRATAQLLEATLGASGAQGLLLANTTHASRAWVYTPVAGTTFHLSQPLAPVAMPIGFSATPAEVDTWANLDSVQILQLPDVNLIQVEPIFEELNASITPGVLLYQLHSKSFGPLPTFDSTFINNFVTAVECSFQRAVSVHGAPNIDSPFIQTNCYFNYLFAQRQDGSDTQLSLFGGAIAKGLGCSSFLGDADLILGGLADVDGNLAQFGLVYIDTANILKVRGPTQFATLFYGSAALWGPGTLNGQGSARMGYTGSAVSIFLLTGGMQLNGAATAQAYSTAAGVGTWNGPRALSAAQLDATVAGGGFGGQAINPGGASIVSGSGL